MQSVLSGLSSKLLSTLMECKIHMHEDRVEFGSTQRLPWRQMMNMTDDASKIMMSWDTDLKNELMIFFQQYKSRT